MKNKYTFIANYKGGVYISQYIAFNLMEALSLWALGLDKKIFSESKRDKILLEITDPDLWPTSVKEVENVWCSTFLTGKTFLLLNIVETT